MGSHGGVLDSGVLLRLSWSFAWQEGVGKVGLVDLAIA
jgi:hypothetical protein